MNGLRTHTHVKGANSNTYVYYIQATAPLVQLGLSVFVVGDQFPLPLYLSLVPIVVGISLTSTSEITFDLWSFVALELSNLCFSLRTLFSKDAFKQVDHFSLYFYMSLLATIVTLPLFLVFELPVLLQR